MTDRELLQQVLYALEDIAEAGSDAWGRDRPCVEDAYGLIDALRVRLAQPEQEPVAWVRRHPDGALTAEFLEHAVIEPVRKNSGAWVPLYLAPQPAQKPLTYEQIVEIGRSLPKASAFEMFILFARAIEAAHNIKETK